MATFGSKCEETTFNASISNQIRGSSFKCPTLGVAQNIKAWLQANYYEVPTERIRIRAAIYQKSTNKLVAVSEEKTFDYKFDWQWVTFVFSSPPTLKAEEYWLVLLANLTVEDSKQNNVFVGYVSGGEPTQGCTESATYPTFPDPLTPSTDSTIRCVHCTYTPTEKPLPDKGRLYVYAVADSEEVDASFLINGEGPYYTRETGKTLDLTPGPYKIVGNYKGQTDEKTVTIEKGEIYARTLTFTKMHKFTVVSDPSPINFTFNTEPQSTPFVRELVSGTYTLVMPKSWMIGLDEYVFEQWENGSRKPTRTVTLESPQEVTLTATYRLRQIDEAGPINQRQAKDTLQEVVGQGADLSPTNPLPTEDTGAHSNPEKYVQDHKFSSWPIDRAGAVATLLYGLASPAAHRRTAGLDITLWWIYFYNHSGGAATVWLESPLGTVISGTVQLADNQGVMLNVKPLDVGNQEIFVNASANLVQAQCGGIET